MLPDTTVVVVVSAGPSPRVVPDLTELSIDDARAAIEGLGLVLEPLPDEFSATVPAGGVARQDPAPSTEVARGSTVSVAISLGPDLVAVPPLANLGVDEARAALEAAGLVLGEVKGDPELRAIPIVVLTTSEADEDILRSYELHANAYVTKPVDFDHFIEVVRMTDDFFVNIVKLPRRA